MPEPVLPEVAEPLEGDVAVEPVDPVEPVPVVLPEVLPLVCATAMPPPTARAAAAAMLNN